MSVKMIHLLSGLISEYQGNHRRPFDKRFEALACAVRMSSSVLGKDGTVL